jgi:NAD(P)-dependent dehydrogenase (short-subunit alcohol dehydrogenase family)
MARLIVLGASGSLGRHVLRQALAAGHEVTAFVRTPSKLPPEAQGRVSVHTGDLTAQVPLEPLRGQDALINCAGHVADGESFVDLVDGVVASVESLPASERPVCWFLAGAALLDIDSSGRRGVDRPKLSCPKARRGGSRSGRRRSASILRERWMERAIRVNELARAAILARSPSPRAAWSRKEVPHRARVAPRSSAFPGMRCSPLPQPDRDGEARGGRPQGVPEEGGLRSDRGSPCQRPAARALHVEQRRSNFDKTVVPLFLNEDAGFVR